MFYRKKVTLLTAAMSIVLLGSGCGGSSSDDDKKESVHTGDFAVPTVFAGFPVTLKGAEGHGVAGASSVVYSGQMARNTLRDELKYIVKTPGVTGEGKILDKINLYLKNTKNADGVAPADGLQILSLADKTGFNIKEDRVEEISKGRSLYNTVFGSSGNKISDPMPGVTGTKTTLGVPNGITAQKLLDVWAENAAKNGYLDTTNGYDYSQLFPKFLMGAKSYNQIVDKYLDEYVNTPGTKDNDKPYNNKGVIYTGKEHSWDEGFGYFGAAANYNLLTPAQNHGIKKRKADYFANADANGDGAVSLYTEYTSGLAYYAASFDKDTSATSTYGKDIMNAFLQGRTLITNAVDKDGNARKLTDAERAKLVGYTDTIQDNLELVLAETVYKYAGGAHAKMDAYLTGTAGIGHATPSKADKDYYKQWGELKGFMLAMQYGGTGSKMNKAKFEEIDNLIGYGPVLSDGSQVTGLTGNNFTKSVPSTTAFNDYKANLKAVQTKLADFYGPALKVKQKTIN